MITVGEGATLFLAAVCRVSVRLRRRDTFSALPELQGSLVEYSLSDILSAVPHDVSRV